MVTSVKEIECSEAGHEGEGISRQRGPEVQKRAVGIVLSK